MNLLALIYVLAASTYCQAFESPDVSSVARNLHVPTFSALKRSLFGSLETRSSTCPSVWSDVSKHLTTKFLVNGLCTSDARAAIRASFHDCFNGACDGSLVLAKEYERKENAGLADWAGKLRYLKDKYDVGMADLIQFAGAHATVTCPLGPTVPAFVGRKDSYKASAKGHIPPSNATGDALLKSFKSKGFSATDLAALVGAHSTSKQSFVAKEDAGAAQDTTPGKWDVKFYSQTLDGTAPFSFQSDKNLAKHPVVGQQFKRFVNNQSGWGQAYSSAMAKMSMLGIEDVSKLVDCSLSLPRESSKRA